MKTMIIAAAAALSLTAGSAYADGGDGTIANTFFTQLPGVVAQAQVPNAPVYAQNGQALNQQAQNGAVRAQRQRRLQQLKSGNAECDAERPALAPASFVSAEVFLLQLSPRKAWGSFLSALGMSERPTR